VSVSSLIFSSDNTDDQIAAHTVVIKGVHAFYNNAYHEYSDLDVTQMLRRAVGHLNFKSQFSPLIIVIPRGGHSLVKTL
jgi:hypothetical protein